MIFENKRKNYRGMEIEEYLLTATEKEAAKLEKPIGKKLLGIAWIIMASVFFILAGRVAYLNVLKGNYYQELAEGNRIRSIAIQAPRGKIFDRSGSVLVDNIPTVDAIIIPADFFAGDRDQKEIIKELSRILKINEGEVVGKLESADPESVNPVLLKENLPREESLILAEKSPKFPGVMISNAAIRRYLDGYIFSHVLGYVGKINRKELADNKNYFMTDYIGKQGIEKSYEKYLRGVNGAHQVEADSLGNVKREIGQINPQPGEDLVLTIDSKLQKKIYDELSLILEKTNTKTAAAAVLNPRNGEILALISLPSFDNNSFIGGISMEDYEKIISDPASPLFNRAVSGAYPPGSTIKPLIAAAALSEGVIGGSTTVNCGGAISLGSYRFGDWKIHGATDVRKAIAESCDVFFYSVGGGYGNIPGLGMTKMKKYENLFGLGEKTGIDIPGEAEGFVPDEKWKLERLGEKWFTGNSYHAAIGQGYLTITPIQLVNYISTIANGGTLYRPRLVLQIKENGKDTGEAEPQVIRSNFISSQILKIVQEGMKQTVTEGTARSLNDLPVAIAGKTGTAQFGAENKTHSWFVSYAPCENPEIALAVLVEGGGEGNSAAVPVTRAVYDWYFSGR